MKVKARFGYSVPIIYKEKDTWSDILYMEFNDDCQFDVIDDSDPEWYFVKTKNGNGYCLKETMRVAK